MTSFFQPSDNFRIVISKWNLSNCFCVISFSFSVISLIFHGINPLLKDFLVVNLKLSNFTHWVTFIKVFRLPSFVSFSIDIMFSRIISGCDRFNIPIDIKILLNCHDIIKIDDCKQINETYNASSKESKYLSIYLLILWDEARHLKVQLSISITNIFFIFFIFDTSWSAILIPLFGADCAFIFVVTLFNNSLIHFDFVHVTATCFFGLDVRRVFPNSFFSTVNHGFKAIVHYTNLRILNVNNSVRAGEIHCSRANTFYITTNSGSSIITQRNFIKLVVWLEF